MVQKSQACALVPVLVVLCLMLQNSHANLCSKTAAASLKQTKYLIMDIEDKTKQLYESYLTHQGLHSIAALICHRSISEFPNRDITNETDSEMLKKLYKTLQYMKNSLAIIQEQQRDLNHEDASLHTELKNAKLIVAGLLQNTKCTLRLQGLTPASIAPPTRPTPPDIFSVKREGCQVLWNYSKFISHLSQTFKGR